MPAALLLSKPVTRTSPPLSDVEAVTEETSARDANRLLRQGWRLLQVIHAQDGAGGYPVYVLGKPSANTAPALA